ncbi:MAG: cytochrome c [bacterium]
MKTWTKALVAAGALAIAASGVARADEVADKQFKKYCQKCHGAEGKGDGAEGATLAEKPRDFTDCAAMAKESDDKLFEVVKVGGKAIAGKKSEMPAMGKSLSDDEIKNLVAKVRSFCATGAKP